MADNSVDLSFLFSVAEGAAASNAAQQMVASRVAPDTVKSYQDKMKKI